MKLLAYAAVLFVLMGGVAWVATSLKARRAARQPWEVREKADDNAVTVYCFQPGTGEMLLLPESVQFSDPEFDFKIELVRSDARSKLVALNSGRKELNK